MAADYDAFEAQLTALLRTVLNDRSTTATGDSKAADLAAAIRGALEPTVTDEMQAHIDHPNPHPQYVLEEEAEQAYQPKHDTLTGLSELVTVDLTNERVGFGTTTPEKMLHLVGTPGVNGAGVLRIDHSGNSPGLLLVRTDGKAGGLSAGPNGAIFLYDQTGFLSFYARPREDVEAGIGGGTPALRLYGSGSGRKVEVGFDLQVNGTATVGGKAVSLADHDHAGTYDPAGTAETERAAHEADPNAHPQYLTEAPVSSVDGRTGAVTLDDLYASKTHNHDTNYQPKSDNLTAIDEQITSDTGTGRVGVKTDAPEVDLHVHGNQIRVKTDSGNAGFVATRDGGGVIWMGAGTSQSGFMIPDDATFAIKAQNRSSLAAGLFGGSNAILITGSTRLVRMLANAQVDGTLTVGGETVSTSSHNHDGSYAPLTHDHDGTYDPAGTASTAIATHEGAADPHTGYQLKTAKGEANGYASLDENGKVPLEELPDIGGSFDPAYGSWKVTTDGTGGTGTMLPFSGASTNVTPAGMSISLGTVTVTEAGIYEISGLLMLSSPLAEGPEGATLEVSAGTTTQTLEAVLVDGARRAVPFGLVASLSASGGITVVCSPEGTAQLAVLAGSTLNVKRIG